MKEQERMTKLDREEEEEDRKRLEEAELSNEELILVQNENKEKEKEKDLKMTKLIKVLGKLEKEGLQVRDERDILVTVKFLGQTGITKGRGKFNVSYTEKGEFTLETSWSNQLITDEWLKQAIRLHKIVKS